MNRALIVEAIGTFFLALVAALSGSPLAAGLTLAVMIYAGGHISGGHYNPAVTLGVLLRGKITMSNAVLYWIGQFSAAGAAIVIGLLWHVKDSGVSQSFDALDFMRMLVGEVLGTFALVYVILNVATVKATEGNHYFGAAIGLTVTAVGSALRGAAFNPAVAVTLAVLVKAPWFIILTCAIGAPVGAAAAAFVVNLLQGEKTHIPSLPSAAAGGAPPPPPPPPPVA